MAQVEGHQLIALDPLDGLDSALCGTPVRMIRTVEQGGQRHRGADRRIVFVLAQTRDGLCAPFAELPCRKRRAPEDVGDNAQHLGEILGQAGTRHGHRVASGRHLQGNAPLVERLGEILGRAPLGAAIDDARGHVGKAWKAGRVVHAARADHRTDGDGRRRCVRLHQQDRAIVEHGPYGRQAARQCGGHAVSPAGLNQPTVRVAVPRRRRATSQTCSAVTSSMQG